MLSIRTQDRMRLVPYGYVYIEQNELGRRFKTNGTNETEPFYSYDLHIYVDKVISIELGTYATKERALEVLDSITAVVMLEDLVYQMPKEEK
jgi:hypothetical protein